MIKFTKALLVLAGVILANASHAQDWPTKPIRLILPLPAGNNNDLAARIVADKLTEKYGQRVVVENYGGAGGIIGAQKFLASPNDGHTFAFFPGSVVMTTPLLYKDAGYDPAKDFVPVAPVGEAPYMIAVGAKSGINSLSELIQRAKAEPGKLKFATQFIGSGNHLVSERFVASLGAKFTMVPYKGVTEAVTSLLNGETQVTMQAVSTVASLVKDNQLRAFAVTSRGRLPGWPDVPATSEQFPNSEATAWFGIFALANTPPAIVSRLSADIDAVIRMPDVMQRFATGGIYPVHGQQKELQEKIALETPIFRKIIMDNNIRIN